MTTPAVGDLVYLKSILTNVHIYGVVTDGETPDLFSATLEIAGENATLSTAALVGPRGPAGTSMFALRFQMSTIDDPEDLPTNLTDDEQDVGKYWIMNQYDNINEIQRIALLGGATTGTFTLTFNGEETIPISVAATATTVETALLGLPNIGPGEVAVDGPAGGPWIVEFQADKSGIAQNMISGDGTLLSGGTDEEVDVSRTQVGEIVPIGSRAYIWYGDHYRILAMGSEGPAGPVPNISWGIKLIDPDTTEQSWVEQSGTAYNPSVLLHIKAPRGPRGYNATIRDSTDYDDSEEPEIGQVMMWDGTNWKPSWVGSIIPKFFTVPQASFTDFEGFSTRAPIGSFAVPPLDFAWKPMVWGKIKAFGLELDSDPLIIGSEVRLGHPTTGQLVSRGFGNSSNWAHLSPHTSMNSDPATAITPDNATALVPANHTGTAGTLYFNLYNDGLTGVYIFHKANAQIALLAVPIAILPD